MKNRQIIISVRDIRLNLMKALRSYLYLSEISKDEFVQKLSAVKEGLILLISEVASSEVEKPKEQKVKKEKVKKVRNEEGEEIVEA